MLSENNDIAIKFDKFNKQFVSINSMIEINLHFYKFVGTVLFIMKSNKSIVLHNKIIYKLRNEVVNSRKNRNQNQDFREK